jgi:hypothetical protein
MPSPSTEELYARVFGSSMISDDKRYAKVQITDIPLILTSSNKLVCIPNTKEVKHIGCVGATGTGKSVSMNSLLSWMYWLVGNDCLILNDIQRDTLEWSLPNPTPSRMLKYIGMSPCPSPIVYVYPKTKTLQLDSIDIKFPHLTMTLPLKEIIKNVEKYWQLDKSKVYLENIKKDLIECKSMEEIMEKIEEKFPKEMKMQGTKNKIQNIFQDIFNNELVNIASPESPAWLEYKDKFGREYYNSTVTSILRAGFIPSIQTYNLRTYEFLSAYMSFIVEKLYYDQFDDPHFKKRTISLFVDEIDKLWLGKNSDSIKASLNMIATNGRAARVRLIWATQNYAAVTKAITSCTKYLIIFPFPKSDIIREIQKDFTIPKEMEKEIQTLRKDPKNGIFEVFVVPVEPFVIYDLDTGDKTESMTAMKGFLVPNIARHKIPNVSI